MIQRLKSTMPEASVSRIPQRESAGMRGTDGQDQAVDRVRSWRSDRRVWWAAAALLLLLLGVSAWLLRGWASSDATVARERVRIATVTRGEFVSDVAAQATVVAAVSPVLYSPAQGTVLLSVQAGDKVSKGDVVATLDSPALRNEYDREYATLEGMTVDLKRQEIDVRRKILGSQQTSDMAGVAIRGAEREFARAQQAWDQQVISERDYQRARDELDEAKLTHDHSLETSSLEKEGLKFELQTSRLQRERQQLLVADLERRVESLAVRSPVDGMVGSISVSEKAAVPQDAALLSVVDLSALEVEFRVAESYAGALGLGMPAEIGYGGKNFPGEVTAVSPEVHQGEVTGRVRFKDEPPAGLRQNQRVSVRIVMDRRDGVLKVERGGFYEAGGGKVAYVVHGDTAERMSITTGATSVREVEITGGLDEGAQIVVSDTDGFKEAARVLLAD